MFFDNCKIVINSYNEYLEFTSHFFDLCKASTGLSTENITYPLYVMVNDSMTVEHTYDKSQFDAHSNTRVSLDTFVHMKYIVSQHFRTRFRERYEDSSNTRFKKLVKDMLKRGTWMKRKDTIQALKYKKVSNYVLFSKFKDGEKVHYLIVVSDTNILTTIYEFNIKDMKFFKET